jgi:hypothetical protein
MALDQSSLLELLKAHKLAEVDDRSRTAAKMPPWSVRATPPSGTSPGEGASPGVVHFPDLLLGDCVDASS